MPYIDPNSVHNPAAGVLAPAAWGDMVNNNLDFLHARLGKTYVLPAVEWDGTTYFPTPNTAYSNVSAVSSRPSATSQYVHFNWWVPYDFASTVSLLVFYIPTTTGTPTLECVSNYRAAFEVHNAHTGNLTEAKSQTGGSLMAWNIAAALPNMAGGDHCSIRIRPTASWPGGNFGALSLLHLFYRS